MGASEWIVPVCGAAGVIFGTGGIWGYLTERAKSRLAAQAAAISAPERIAESQAALADAISQQTKDLLAENKQDRKELRQQVNRLGREVRSLKSQVDDCNGKHQDCERTVSVLRADIDRLMAERPPASEVFINPHRLEG